MDEDFVLVYKEEAHDKEDCASVSGSSSASALLVEDPLDRLALSREWHSQSDEEDEEHKVEAEAIAPSSEAPLAPEPEPAPPAPEPAPAAEEPKPAKSTPQLEVYCAFWVPVPLGGTGACRSAGFPIVLIVPTTARRGPGRVRKRQVHLPLLRVQFSLWLPGNCISVLPASYTDSRVSRMGEVAVAACAYAVGLGYTCLCISFCLDQLKLPICLYDNYLCLV